MPNDNEQRDGEWYDNEFVRLYAHGDEEALQNGEMDTDFAIVRRKLIGSHQYLYDLATLPVVDGEVFMQQIIDAVRDAESENEMEEACEAAIADYISSIGFEMVGSLCILEADAKALERLGYADGYLEVIHRARQMEKDFGEYIYRHEQQRKYPQVNEPFEINADTLGYAITPILVKEPHFVDFVSGFVVNMVLDSETSIGDVLKTIEEQVAQQQINSPQELAQAIWNLAVVNGRLPMLLLRSGLMLTDFASRLGMWKYYMPYAAQE